MAGLAAATCLPSGEPPSSVLVMFADQCARAPQRIAVQCGGRQLTYAELDARATVLAQVLVARGVQAGERVGVSLPRSEAMLVAVLGVLKAGAAYVPLDPAFPAERLRYMAGHARLRVVVGDTRADVPAVVAEGREVLELSRLPYVPVDAAGLPPVHGDDAAYVLYTSGSTGVPKGVCVLHRNLANFLASMRVEPGFAEGEVLCAVTTLSFDIAGLELYLPLVAGGRVLVATGAECRDPAALLRLLAAQGVGVLQTTPALARMLVDQDDAQVLRGLRLLVGGEEMPRDLARRLVGRAGAVWNLYGPTETTVWSALSRVVEAGAGAGAVPLGHPVAHTAIHVLDEQRQEVAEGEVGEIWIGGAGVAQGYLFQDALTAERFVPDSFAGDGSRMYRTGDLGSVRDGQLHFHGRADQQVKLRGYRIELGEVEAAALAETGVREAAAAVCVVGAGDQRLVLYAVARAADAGLAERLRASLRARLPGYMLPQHVEWLDALPQTPNGKVDRKALPMPAALAAAQARTLPPQRDDARLRAQAGTESALPRPGIRGQLGRWCHGLGVLPLLQRVRRWGRRDLRVLAYHRVLDVPDVNRFDFDLELVSASVDGFREQMRWLQRHMRPLRLADVVAALDAGTALPADAVVVTFDDGYDDNYRNAFPILRELGVPATFFVSTGHVDSGLPYAYDWLVHMILRAPLAGPVIPELDLALPAGATRAARRALAKQALDRIKRLDSPAQASLIARLECEWGMPRQGGNADCRPLQWAQVREMHTAGFEIGSHGVHHRMLATLPQGELEAELRDSRLTLEHELGAGINTIAYPVGGDDAFDRRVVGATRAAGYRLGCSYISGTNRHGATDRYALRRLAVEREMDVGWFAGMLTLPGLLSYPAVNHVT